MPDVIVVGGGVIGLSIAWELAGHGVLVRVLERKAFGTEASWAGAGMLPPGSLSGAKTPEARLRGAAHELWPEWSRSLTSTTGIDNGYLNCGGLEVRFAENDPTGESLNQEIATLRGEGVLVETNDLEEIRRRFPMLGPDLTAAYYLPGFCQVRNPRHLKSLLSGCQGRGVELIADASVTGIETANERITAVRASGLDHRAEQFVFACGAWTGKLLEQIGIQVPIEPLKGQIVLLNADPSPIQSVVQVGREYLVPRSDGRILVGSTEERTGFDKRTSDEAIEDLIRFAHRVVPGLKDAAVEKSWAGLRPYSGAGRPFIGRLPQFENACIAAGHFRYGLDLSPVTAVLIRQILLGQAVLLPEEARVANDELGN